MLLLAIDPATKTGIAEGAPGEKPRLATLDFGRPDESGPEQIYARAVTWFAKRLRNDVPHMMAIEQPFPSQNHATTLISIGLFGIFVGIARTKGIPVREAPIQTWRKYALGVGNLPGHEAKRRALILCERLRWLAPDHNAAEAAMIWLWLCGQVDPRKATRPEPLFAVEAMR